MAEPEDRNTEGAPPNHVHIEKDNKTNWLAWILLALGILALLFALSRCGRDDAPTAAVAPVPVDTNTAAPATPPVAVEQVALPNGRTVDLEPASLNYELQRYLASDAPAPRTFTFDKLNFDTASATLRPDDQQTLNALGQIMTAYPNAKVRLIGYADARGTEPSNDQLGIQRAQAVAQALTGAGIAGNRVATASGGENDPVASNATPGGQFENRRTELEVTAK